MNGLLEKEEAGWWAALLLRLAMASLFFAAAVPKLKGGSASIHATVDYFQKLFAQTWLPGPLVTLQAYITPFAEAILSIWLVVGWRLRLAWFITGLYTIALAFGMAVAGKHDVAANNYLYVLIAAIGLYLSPFDRCRLGDRLVS